MDERHWHVLRFLEEAGVPEAWINVDQALCILGYTNEDTADVLNDLETLGAVRETLGDYELTGAGENLLYDARGA